MRAEFAFLQYAKTSVQADDVFSNEIRPTGLTKNHHNSISNFHKNAKSKTPETKPHNREFYFFSPFSGDGSPLNVLIAKAGGAIFKSIPLS